ncbi:MAG: hypothetical protein LBT98_02615 [Puniceicoccales bacterium]|nr:hypothetical protein [Puniceicoccales bacterium]
MADRIVQRTYFFDSLRHLFQGALDSAFLTICLLISIRVFHAPNGLKSVLSSLTWLGGALAPALTRLAARSGRPAARIGALLFFAIGCCFLGAARAQSFILFLLPVACASVCYRAEGSVLIGMYAANYGAEQRASRLALGLTLSALLAVALGQIGGIALDRDLANHRPLLQVIAACSWCCSLCLLAIPSPPVRRPSGQPWRGYLPFLWKDPTFGRLTLHFCLVGIAYQMLVPIRMEYLANGRYGMDLANGRVMLLAWVVPNLARVASTQLFGFLFDRFRLIPLRIANNLLTFAAFWIFFHGKNFGTLILGAGCMGMAMAGSYVFHSLWISKVAPEERLPAYMSLYLLVTGVRSMVAPLLAYALLAVLSPTGVANFAGLLIAWSTLGFWRLRRVETIR